jgi:hypothetical protein
MWKATAHPPLETRELFGRANLLQVLSSGAARDA